jgi:hypothetical protein
MDKSSHLSTVEFEIGLIPEHSLISVGPHFLDALAQLYGLLYVRACIWFLYSANVT